jgi:hypothetical protein
VEITLVSLEQQDFCLSSSLKQQRERARIIAADIVEHECSPGFVSTEHMSIGEADNLSRALTKHVLAGKASDLRFASTEQELTGKRHNLSIASTKQELTDPVTLAGVPISMDILFEKMSGLQILVPQTMARTGTWEERMYKQVLPPTLVSMEEP